MKRVLILDDDVTTLIICQEALFNAGYDVTVLNDSMELDSCLSQDSFDLLITDIFMPNKEGLEIIREVPKSYPDMKIIAMSGARESNAYLNIAKDLGSSSTLEKPFTLVTLLDATESAINS